MADSQAPKDPDPTQPQHHQWDSHKECDTCFVWFFCLISQPPIHINWLCLHLYPKERNWRRKRTLFCPFPFLWVLSSFRCKTQATWKKSQPRASSDGRVKSNCGVATMPGCQEWLETPWRGGWPSAVSRVSTCASSPAAQLKASLVLRPASNSDPHWTFYYGT